MCVFAHMNATGQETGRYKIITTYLMAPIMT